MTIAVDLGRKATKPTNQLSLIFIKLYSTGPLSEMMCRAHDPSYIDWMLRSQVRVKGFTLEFCVRSISPEPFKRFLLNFMQMSHSLRRCAEPWLGNADSRSHFKVVWLQYRVQSISPKHFERFSLYFTQMFLLVRPCARHIVQLLGYADSRSRSQFKVMGFIFEHRVLSISADPCERFSLNFTQMFLSMSWCAEHLVSHANLKSKSLTAILFMHYSSPCTTGDAPELSSGNLIRV